MRLLRQICTISRTLPNVHHASSNIVIASTFCSRVASPLTPSFKPNENAELDRLFPRIQLEYRGHDVAVLKSFTTFLKAVCQHLELQVVSVKVFPYVWWIQNALRAKFAKKKNQLHYETRTHIRQFTIRNVTGSTASTFLEYIQRNIPEGVAMKVTYDELASLPEMILNKMKALQLNENSETSPALSPAEQCIVDGLIKGEANFASATKTSSETQISEK